MSRPRVLIMAESANPEMVSVPLVGWSLAKALREICDAHIVTQIRNRDAFVRAGLVEGVDFTSLNTEALARPLWKAGSLLGRGAWTAKQAISSISDAYFEHMVWKAFGGQISSGHWDIVHRITPLTPTKPSSVAKKCARHGIPFILGPLNGGVPWPKGFNRERIREGELLSYVRDVYKLLPGRAKTLNSASAILVGSRHTMSEIPQIFSQKTIYLPENGIDPERFNLTAQPGRKEGTLRGCFVGRMVPYKGPDILLEAAAPLLRSGKLELDLIGDGPMLSIVEELSKSLEVHNAVRFHGWLRHDEVQEVMASCDMLTFPSIREFGGGVVLEAMALGIPPLVVDYAGPGELVQTEWGYKIPIGKREDIISALQNQLSECVSSPEELARKGVAAKKRVDDEFTWIRKANQIACVYDWVRARNDSPAPTLLTVDHF